MGAGCFVTPVMNGAETVRLLNAQPASHDVASKSAMIRSALQVMNPEVAQVLVDLSFTDQEIYEESQRAGVELADGDTDTESVCDFDSGAGTELSEKGAEVRTGMFGKQGIFLTKLSASAENAFLIFTRPRAPK